MNINVSVSLFVLFMCLGIIVHPAFFILCMAVIIFLCLNNKQMQKEDFGYYTLNTVRKNPPPSSCKFNAKSGPWCGDYEELDTDDNSFRSSNQALVGKKVNPRTLVAPLIAPPLADFEYWKKDNFSAYPSIVNRPRQQDLYLSGYVGGPCARGINSSCGQAVQPNIVKENFELSNEVRDIYAREFSTEGNIDQQYVNKRYVENALEGGYKDPFAETCYKRVPTLQFNNPDFKSMDGCVPQVGLIRENFEEILKHYFKEVFVAKSSKEAYEKYLLEKPDLFKRLSTFLIASVLTFVTILKTAFFIVEGNLLLSSLIVLINCPMVISIIKILY